jgi:hypothetical protein
LVTATKDPTKVRAGTIGARVRWGEPRVVRLDDLTPSQKRLVLALIAAAREEAGPVSETTGTGQEARRVAGEPTSE